MIKSPSPQRLRNPHPTFRMGALAAACALLAAEASSVHAQTAPVPKESATLGAITVTGIRASLDSAMNLKRDAQGVVDGINAEEIGKFPDTNLAESLQRISGVSIDRANGEGNRITVRGVGPDFNMVLLNGRQMPASSLVGGGAPSSRAFDFANLASEAVAGIEVYKTSRASSPTGGIGATINIKTARPLGNPDVANIGFKEVIDTSNTNLPSHLQGKNATPEFSGIYSGTFADGKFGIAITGSHQERSLGFNQASVPNGWRAVTPTNGDWGGAGSKAPTNFDVYSVPQNPNYSMTSVQRQRDNGQLTLQYAPSSDMKATLDYTVSQNKLQTRRNDLGVWMGFGGAVTDATFTPGKVTGPAVFTEAYGNPGDIAMGVADFAQKTENKSLGFNLEWKVSSRLKLELDAHRSTAESSPDSPYGSGGVLGGAQFTRTGTSINFTDKFPVISITGGDVDPSKMVVTGSTFQNSYQRSLVEQLQVKGSFELDELSGLKFGLGTTKVENRSAFANMQRDSWGGVGSPADYADSSWRKDTLRQYFSKISGSGNPALYNQILFGDFATLRNQVIAASGHPEWYVAPTEYTTDRRTTEKSLSGYAQYQKEWDTAMPMHAAVGYRYEKTDVVSSALVPIPTGISWEANNEYSVHFSPNQDFTAQEGSYSYLLPSADFDVDLSKNLKFRASYGETIGRPGWEAIQGGQSLDGLARINGGTGASGNPNLKPLKSKNIDLSLEYYYDKGSFASVGYFTKQIENYIGSGIVTSTPFNLKTPANGLWWKEAVAQGCANDDVTCIRDYILLTKNGQGGVVRGADANGHLTGTIPAQSGDPITPFNITVPTNERADALKGWEFNLQHMFGSSGFGASVNYTKVSSGLAFDNASTAQQFALIGVGDSANLVAFYENSKWSVRGAYNWRAEFLAALGDGAGGQSNPMYTEAYGQLDVNVGYKWDNHLTLQVEAINLTDGIQRLHGRSSTQVNFVTQTGPRYMFGLRYQF